MKPGRLKTPKRVPCGHLPALRTPVLKKAGKVLTSCAGGDPLDAMTFTQQITPYTCALACLESFYRDHGNPITQQTLLRDHPAKCFVGRIHEGRDISGALALDEFTDLCVDLGLAPVVGRDFKPEITIPFVLAVQQRQAIIFFVTHFNGGGGPQHVVGFSHMSDADVFQVMNPSGNPSFRPITRQQLVAWGTSFVRITLANEPGKA